MVETGMTEKTPNTLYGGGMRRRISLSVYSKESQLPVKLDHLQEQGKHRLPQEKITIPEGSESRRRGRDDQVESVDLRDALSAVFGLSELKGDHQTEPPLKQYFKGEAFNTILKVSASSSTPGISPDVAKLKDMMKALLLDKKNQTQAPAPVKAVEESCVTFRGAHSYRNCPATDGNIYRDNIQEYVSQAAVTNFNQGNTSYRAPIANQIRPPSLSTLPGNTIPNLKEDLEGITTRSGISYQEPTIPTTSSSPPKVVEHETEVTKNTVPPTNNESTKDVQPSVVQV
ncbi:hypothetical protein Tco_1546945 [Tanacetum coccineum]